MKTWCVLFMLLLSVTVGSTVSASAPDVVGVARDMETKSLLYSEKHFVELDSDGQVVQRKVIYEAPNGEEIASKTNEYGGARWAPAFELVDFRSGYREQLLVNEQHFVLRIREGDSSSWQQEIIPRDNDDQHWVADAGFDQFVRDHMARLKQGESVDFEFLSPARLASVAFRLVPVEQSATRIRVKMVLQNPVLRLLLDPIVLDYDIEPPRLIRFAGITNLSTESGKHYEAAIEYTYGNGDE